MMLSVSGVFGESLWKAGYSNTSNGVKIFNNYTYVIDNTKPLISQGVVSFKCAMDYDMRIGTGYEIYVDDYQNNTNIPWKQIKFVIKNITKNINDEMCSGIKMTNPDYKEIPKQLSNETLLPIVTQIATNTTFTNPPVLDKSLYTIPANPLLATPTATLTPATVTNTATPFIAGLDKYTFTRNLKVGMKDKDVEVLQKLLGLTPTGYFGLSTRNMVVLYQKKNNLPATGFVGPSTRAVLNR